MSVYDEIKKEIQKMKKMKVHKCYTEPILYLTRWQYKEYKEEIPPNQLVYIVNNDELIRNGITIYE